MLLIVAFLLLAFGCQKSDEDPDEATTSGTIKDIDGNVYHIDTIGTQVWMVENLKTTKYRDGSPIPKVTNNNEWGSLTTAAYCNWNNDPAIDSKYGKLYNWYAVDDIHSIAPEGWHVATDDEWKALARFVADSLGTSGSVAKVITALLGGNRTNDGTFGFINYLGGWWSSSESYTYNAWARICYDSYGMERGSYGKNSGFSVRCIKDLD
jgi:uncharacterized protein (TIGR02145 family)